MSKNEIEIKASLSQAETARYLQELAQCLSAGKVVVQRGTEYLELRPQHRLELEIEAVRKKDKEKISLELSWRLESPERPAEDFKISSETPALPAEETADSLAVTAAAAAAEGEKADPLAADKEKAGRSCRK